MTRDTLRRSIGNVSKEVVKPRVYHGRLAEDYDGIGQYVQVSLSPSSVSSAYKARIASGDFGTGQRIPMGTLITIFSIHGQLEVVSLGVK